MTLQMMALVGAGVIGAGVAVVHGVLVQRLMVRPFVASGAAARPAGRLVPPLLQFTTYNWLLGGVALVAAALWLEPQARLVTAGLVGSSYLFGAVGNFWGTRGRHPGWVLYAVALGLIVYAVI
ncbi:hypothetical protein QO010_000329 [Caulobacter ginsengisoli]|uniref:Integral membrane protein n=1 Tax=Caulobacter ginsengisoli TaxID=400775 RepID=A0ABU0IKP0_9CAUL|nr:hypothetical protein [Caulobacter ginsengisoli]MDQ0462581.1 hypothetical protein [Caulobacter ginsengisoli]